MLKREDPELAEMASAHVDALLLDLVRSAEDNLNVER